MKINDQLAFPQGRLLADYLSGMTLRDFFAAHAMQALVLTVKSAEDAKKIVTASFVVADAMLEERLK